MCVGGGGGGGGESPFSVVGMSGYDVDIPKEKSLNYLQTVK